MQTSLQQFVSKSSPTLLLSFSRCPVLQTHHIVLPNALHFQASVPGLLIFYFFPLLILESPSPTLSGRINSRGIFHASPVSFTLRHVFNILSIFTLLQIFPPFSQSQNSVPRKTKALRKMSQDAEGDKLLK